MYKISKFLLILFISITFVSCFGGNSSSSNDGNFQNLCTDFFNPNCDNDADGVLFRCDANDNDPLNRSLKPECLSDNNNTPQPGNNNNGNGNNTNTNTTPRPSYLDSDGDGISDDCDEGPNDPLNKRFKAVCDRDRDFLLDQDCIALLGKTDGELITAEEYRLVGNLCDNCIPFFNNGNIDTDSDGIGDACDDDTVLINPCEENPELPECVPVVDQPELPEKGAPIASGDIYITSLMLDNEGLGNAAYPYGYNRIQEFINNPNISAIKILGNGRIVGSFTIDRLEENNLSISGGYGCSMEFHPETKGCLGEISSIAKDEDQNLILENLPTIVSVANRPVFTLKEGFITLRQLNMIGFQDDLVNSFTVPDSDDDTIDEETKQHDTYATIYIVNANPSIYQNYIQAPINHPDFGERVNVVLNQNLHASYGIYVNAQTRSLIDINNNFIEVGIDETKTCAEPDEEIVSKNAGIYITTKNQIIDYESYISIDQNDIKVGPAYTSSQGIFVEFSRNANSVENISQVIRNKIQVDCSNSSIGIRGLSFNTNVSKNFIEIKARDNSPAHRSVMRGISLGLVAGASIGQIAVQDNAIKLNPSQNENIFEVSGMVLTDISSDIFSNTIVINGDEEKRLRGLFLNSVNGNPLFSQGGNNTKVVNNLFIKNDSEAENSVVIEVARSRAELALMIPYIFRNNAFSYNFQKIHVRINAELPPYETVEIFGRESIGVVDGTHSQILGDFLSPDNSYNLNPLYGLNPDTLNFVPGSDHLSIGNGYVFSSNRNNPDQLYGSTRDILAKNRNPNNPTIGAYQFFE